MPSVHPIRWAVKGAKSVAGAAEAAANVVNEGGRNSVGYPQTPHDLHPTRGWVPRNTKTAPPRTYAAKKRPG